ncbi:MAG: hypothetical protein U1G07_06775 [Verrucomicrobiota bacterium]
MRARWAAAPTNAALAAQLATRYIERCRAEGDPRQLGHAEAILGSWWEQEKPPTDVLVLRATIRQSRHEFRAALADLGGVLRVAPNHAQAWLTQATILTVLGRYEEARRSCLPLLRLTSELVAVTAGASVASLSGQAERSCQTLERALERANAASPSERVWALTVLAETSARLGRSADAERFFREAMALGHRDVYLLGAMADFLLDQNRAAEVLALLRAETRVDALLLRLCLAEVSLNPRAPEAVAHCAALEDRFQASRLRGDFAHQREEARFLLNVRQQPVQALRCARANWEAQKEPADLRIALEAALAVRDAAAAAPCLAFLKEHGLEDVAIGKLAAELQALPAL